jgi:ribonuclease Z
MRLHCLGTTGYHPSPSRHTACYYISDLALVFDAGTGIFRLIEHLLKEPKSSIDILLSHAHLDHVVGLTFLLDALAVTDLKTIRVFGEAAKLDAIREHIYSELLFPVLPPMEFLPLDGESGTLRLGEQRETLVRYFPLEHPGGTIGYVVESEGKKVAYVTDTIARPDANYLKELINIDLLLHECYFSNDYTELAVRTGHSWLDAVADVVGKVCPKRTALIHINPLAEILGNGFAISSEHEALNMFVAEDCQEIDV